MGLWLHVWNKAWIKKEKQIIEKLVITKHITLKYSSNAD